VPDNPAVERLLAVVEKLLDADVCAPYYSAWEMHEAYCGSNENDGEALHSELRAAYEGVKGAQLDAAGAQDAVARHNARLEAAYNSTPLHSAFGGEQVGGD
jgi:hypothetical protein